MELNKYGVTLRRLTEDKIELVRYWRNQPKIQQYMEYREHITAEMQLAWFHKIDNDLNYFFIIEWEGKEIGLINIKDINREEHTGEPGIFIWDDQCLNSDISFRASLCMLDWAFEELQLESTYAHILTDNKRSIEFAKARGYKLAPNQEGVENQLYTLKKADYEKHKKLILRIFK